ncbi:hypothetical protein D3C81_479280 [compost metagenome]
MIRTLGFENFKRFKSESLDLTKPITLMYGENSSGKSSALKGLAALIQTFSWTRNKHEAFVAHGDYTNLGIYRDYVYNHDVSNKISILLTVPPDRWYGKYGDRKVVDFKIRLCYDRHVFTEQARIYSVEAVVYFLDGTFRELLRLKRAETKAYYTLVTDPEALEVEANLFGRNKYSSKDVRRVAGLKTKLKYTEKFSFGFVNAEEEDSLPGVKLRIFERMMYLIYHLPESYKYLGPLRSSPSRSYTISAASSDVGGTGENTPSVISYLKRSSESNRSNRDAYRKILHWIDLIFPGRSISVEDFEELVKIKVIRGGVADSIQDVGFGFSQVLPIIVQTAACRPGNVIVIEQPELHLHPRAQVSFARFLVEASRDGKHFIIETHSEHILRGLQLAISEHSLDSEDGMSKDDLKVYYFPSEADAKIFEIGITEDGELAEGWPAGFFDESYNLTKRIISNKIRRMTGEVI